MVTRRAFLGMVGSAGLTGAGLAAGAKLLSANGGDGPGYPEIRYGSEACARCWMVIDDARFAAAWIDSSGEEVHFDDIGCAALEAAERALESGARIFVHDFTTQGWLDGRTAGYVLSPASIRTPMAYGLAAVQDRAAAEALARRAEGRVLTWDELPGLLATETAPAHGHGA